MGTRRNSFVRASQTGELGTMTAVCTVGYHAPPPGSHSGIADYAETLRTALQRLGQVEVSDTGVNHADIQLYHLGNNRLHQDIYARALATPGVAVLHDAVLHHFMLGALSQDEYLSEWIYNYGEWRRDLGEELWRERARANVDPRYFQFPMLRRIVERSPVVIVHNPGAAALVRGQGARNVVVIPHFCEAGEPSGALMVDAARFRQKLGIGDGTRLFGIFGYLREPKRVLPCIRAFRRLHAVRPETALLLAGEVVSKDLERALQNEAPHPAIRRLGRLSEKDFRIAAVAVDCCLNLRYPGAGETSGIAIRLMGLGKPVIVTDNAENADFPPAAVLRVSPGVAEAEELFEHMVLVTGFAAVARKIGSEARLHIRQRHALDQVARQYWETLCAAVSSSS
jgi:glycosyltransferase involved in cell wall biosynthesis